MLIPALGVRNRELHTATEDCLDARKVHRAWFLSGQVATGEQEAARGTDDEGDPESDFEEEYHPYDSDEDDHEGAPEPKVPPAEAAPSLPRPSLARGPPVEPVIARAMPICMQCAMPSLKTLHTCARPRCRKPMLIRMAFYKGMAPSLPPPGWHGARVLYLGVFDPALHDGALR